VSSALKKENNWSNLASRRLSPATRGIDEIGFIRRAGPAENDVCSVLYGNCQSLNPVGSLQQEKKNH
jgi:hypothetical protein